MSTTKTPKAPKTKKTTRKKAERATQVVSPVGELPLSASTQQPAPAAPDPTPTAPVPAPVVEVPDDETSRIAAELQALQRQRAILIKSRNMQANRLQAIIAGTIGYHSGMSEPDRKKIFAEASAIIKDIEARRNMTHPLCGIVRVTLTGINAFNDMKDGIESEMRRFVYQLPIIEWVNHKDQLGFGELFLAQVIGECGDLRRFANPAKVWRWMGCAPWSFEGQTLMGATWRSGQRGKLPAEEWTKFKYNPRRRSIAYLIGEGLMKQNLKTKKTENDDDDDNDDDKKKKKEVLWRGPYRERYDTARATFAEKNPDYTKKHCQLHGMLCATKLLLKNLWREWNGHPPGRHEDDR